MTSADVAREQVEAFNAGDWERFRATLTDDSMYDELATQRHLEGQEAILDANRGWKDAFPDARGTVERAIESDGTATLEITWEGTQNGALHMPTGDLPPSGRHVVVKAVEVFDIEGGKIRESHHYFDMMGMLQQLGATEQVGAAG
jgi:steroid delta-isomerase-like uncharacterized protein